MKASMLSLSPRRQRFVDEYLVDLNAKQAAIRAGYSAKTAEVCGPRLLRNAQIADAVIARQAKRGERTEITVDRVVRELAVMGLSDIGEVIDFTGPEPRLRPACEIPERARRALASVTVKRTVEGHGDAAQPVEIIAFKLWPKDSALDLLGKHLGMFVAETRPEDAARAALAGAVIIAALGNKPEYMERLQQAREMARKMIEQRGNGRDDV